MRLGKEHNFDIVEGPMADDQIWDYVEDYMANNISKSTFWELVKFKYPTHQIVFCTEDALKTLHLISVANVLHCKNPIEVEDEWISDYKLENGNINVADVDTELVEKIPTATQMGKVYQRLIFDTALPHESEVDGIIRVYNDPICKVIDNYNCSAYYELSYVIARAYQNGGF